MNINRNLGSIDVPQADSLDTVRKIVEAVADGARSSGKIAERTGYSDRHVRYRFQAACILGLLAPDHTLMRRGQRLVGTERGSTEERRLLRAAVRASAVVRIVAPDLLASASIDKEAVAGRLVELTGLSQATARRRAQVLRSWARQLKLE